MGLKKNIVLITSGQPSANPRLVKEALALYKAGYNVKVIYVPISPWADKFDEQLFMLYPNITFIRTGFHPINNKLAYWWVRFRQKVLVSIFKRLGDLYNISDFSLILFGQELLKEAKKHQADLYIAHNLGALPVAFRAALFYGAKVGFDAEDFHRGEMNANSLHFILTKIVEDKYFPRLDYFTAASPLIYKEYAVLYNCKKSKVINNCFPKEHIADSPTFRSPYLPLKLFWFSQKIGKGRGLEDIIIALCVHLCNEPIELTLVGNCSESMREYMVNLVPKDIFNNKVKIINPVSSDDLFSLANQHHIGLALEPGRDLNNEFALSNKIFTYMLAGNALILSDTQAQKEFYCKYPQIGSLYKKGNIKDMTDILRIYLRDPALLSKHQENALRIAGDKLNWDEEKNIFLELVRSVL